MQKRHFKKQGTLRAQRRSIVSYKAISWAGQRETAHQPLGEILSSISKNIKILLGTSGSVWRFSEAGKKKKRRWRRKGE